MEATDGSRRSVRSVSLENNLSVVTPSTPVRPILKPQPYTDPGSVREADCKTPSYVGISCAVNGYSRLNRYDSTLRDGYRSRDASPARLAFSRSRDSSPMRPEWKVFNTRTKASPDATAAKIKELKEELAKFKAEFPHPPSERGRQTSSRRNGRRPPQQPRSVSVDRGYLTKAEDMNGQAEGQRVRLVEISMTDSSSMKSSSYQYSFEKSVIRGGKCETSDSIHCAQTNGDTPNAKSFIQSRIERLYGPSALAAGFRSRRSLLELEKEQKDRQSTYRSPVLPSLDFEPEEKAPEGFPSVFRHLRPEFRTQLPVKKNNRLRADGLESPGSDTQESPQGRVIPITIEGEESIPPVPLPQTDISPVPLPQDLPTVPLPQTDLPTVPLPQTDLTTVPLPQDLPPTPQKKTSQDTETNSEIAPLVNGNGNVEEPKKLTNGVNGVVEEEVVKAKEEVKEDVIGAVVEERTNKVNGEAVTVNGTVSGKVEKDGHFFLKIVEDVVANIEGQVTVIEGELESHGAAMSEEVRGKVLAAVGKARLLVSQKIQQFRGLCHKNIAGSAGEEFPTTCEDLAGFWDMVSIQVSDVSQNLQHLAALRDNGWKELPVDKVDGGGRTVTTGQARRKPAPRPAKATKTKSEEGKARDEARKKMVEERRRMMEERRRAMKAEKNDDQVEIFVPK